MFYNSEILLNRQNIFDHFSPENRNMFQDKNVEFCSKKGYGGNIN